MANPYCIEPARSGRSTCTSCKVVIKQGELRAGTSRMNSSGVEQTSWMHMSCFGKVRNLKITDLDEIDSFLNLKKEEQAQAKKDFQAYKSSSSKSAGGSKAKKSAKDSDSDSDSDVKDKVKKVTITSSLNGYTNVERKKYQENLKDISNYSTARLKELLKQNVQTQSGNKDELLARVADCMTMGTLPNCTKCGGGRLRFNQDNGTYFCKGYMDDADYVNCRAKFEKNQVIRCDWKN